MKVALPFKAQAKAEAIGCFESPFRTFKRLHGHHEDAGGGEDRTRASDPHFFLRIRIRAKIFMRIRILGVSGGGGWG